MRLAIVNGEITEVTRTGQRGICIGCGGEVKSNCGTVRIPYWSHMNKKECSYSQKEPKTEWHYYWQNHFPEENQEVRCQNEQTGEIHIADIKMPNDLVIEFQHSYIDAEERKSREDFYKNMLWVIDGTRYKTYFERFSKNLSSSTKITNANLRVVMYLDKLLPETWHSLTVPVCVDFYSEEDKNNPLRNIIWRFHKNQGAIFLTEIVRDKFADSIWFEDWARRFGKIDITPKQTILSPTKYPKYSSNSRTKVIGSYNGSAYQTKKINKLKNFRF